MKTVPHRHSAEVYAKTTVPKFYAQQISPQEYKNQKIYYTEAAVTRLENYLRHYPREALRASYYFDQLSVISCIIGCAEILKASLNPVFMAFFALFEIIAILLKKFTFFFWLNVTAGEIYKYATDISDPRDESFLTIFGKEISENIKVTPLYFMCFYITIIYSIIVAYILHCIISKLTGGYIKTWNIIIGYFVYTVLSVILPTSLQFIVYPIELLEWGFFKYLVSYLGMGFVYLFMKFVGLFSVIIFMTMTSFIVNENIVRWWIVFILTFFASISTNILALKAFMECIRFFCIRNTNK